MALTHRKYDPDIFIIKADKSSTVVVKTSVYYMSEDNRQLSNTSFYKSLENDLTQTIQQEIYQFLQTNDPNEGFTEYPFTPPLFKLQTLPKIYKQGNVSLPIFSSVNSPTERISVFSMQQLSSLIKDSFHFLKTNPPPPRISVWRRVFSRGKGDYHAH